MEKSELSNDLDELNQALDHIDIELTGQELSGIKNSPQDISNRQDEDYEHFLQDITNDQPIQQLPQNSIDLLSGLVKELTTAIGDASSKVEEDFRLPVEQQNFHQQEQSQKLLDSFFKKELIQQSLLETKQQFQTYLSNHNEPTDITAKHTAQLHLIIEMVKVIATQSEPKLKLLNLYNQYCNLGSPPSGISGLPLIQ